eukprot:jgi/Ulvmu1/1508/UM011_0238.1
MSAAHDPSEFTSKISNIQTLLAGLRQGLEDLKKESTSHLQRSQLLLCQADAAVTLGALLHKLEGCNELTDIMLKSELVMVQAYRQKVQKAVAKDELSTQQKKTEVNVDAMHRFIEHAIPDLDQGQKEGLKRVAEKAAEARDGKASKSILTAEDVDPFATVTAKKGNSATQRAKRRKQRKTADPSAKLLNTILSINPSEEGS